MNRLHLWVLTCVVGLLARPAWTQGFDVSCSLPFEAIKTSNLQIDASCPETGKGDGARAEQNRAKNRFCADGPAHQLSFTIFQTLQRKVDTLVQNGRLQYGSDSSLPDDRSMLSEVTTSDGTALGEGKRVSIVAFIKDAHYSNVSNGESVNCKFTGQESNDVHIVLVNRKTDSACKSVTAEMSPHFRPSTWAPEYLQGLARPVRIVGQLFFDGSHKPCVGSKKASPPRSTVWEIHPVYQVSICKKATIALCPANKAELWEELNDFALRHWPSHSGEE